MIRFFSFNLELICTSLFLKKQLVQFQFFKKTHKCKLIPNLTRKTVWLLINNTCINTKNICVKNVQEDLALRLFSLLEKTFFKVSTQTFRHQFMWYHWLRKYPIFIQPINPEFRFVICTGVTLKLHCPQPIRIE